MAQRWGREGETVSEGMRNEGSGGFEESQGRN